MESPAHDLRETADQLIAEMQELIRGSPTNPSFNTISALSTLRKFACVLVVVSRDADRQSRRIVRLTWALPVLTIILLLFSVPAAVEQYRHTFTHHDKGEP